MAHVMELMLTCADACPGKSALAVLLQPQHAEINFLLQRQNM